MIFAAALSTFFSFFFGGAANVIILNDHARVTWSKSQSNGSLNHYNDDAEDQNSLLLDFVYYYLFLGTES